MPEQHQRWRHAFIELTQDLHRHLDLVAPPVPDADDQALTVGITWRGAEVSLQHGNPDDTVGSAGCMRIQCRFGAVSDDDAERILGQALVANSALARLQAGMFSLDVTDHSLMFSCVESLAATHASELAEALNRIAEAARTWRQRNTSAFH